MAAATGGTAANGLAAQQPSRAGEQSAGIRPRLIARGAALPHQQQLCQMTQWPLSTGICSSRSAVRRTHCANVQVLGAPRSAAACRHWVQRCQQQHQQHLQRGAVRLAAAADGDSAETATSQQTPGDGNSSTAQNEPADAAYAQQLLDWGFTQVAQPLPEGISLRALAETLPSTVFQIDLRQAFVRLALSVTLMAAGYSWLWYMHSVCPLWQQLLCWAAIGTGYFGAFVLATDAAHFALCPSLPLVQEVIGAALMAPSLWSFETWRLQYFNHLISLNMLEEDTDAWHPITIPELASMSDTRLTLTRLILGTPLKLWATIGAWARSWASFDLRMYVTRMRPWVLLSWAVPFGFMGVVWPAMLAAGGLAGWASWWLAPWLVFHGWLGLLTLVQHTAPCIPFRQQGPEYDAAQAAINGTVTLRLPRPLELLLHDANYHLPQHISISIPSYHLKAAYEALRERLGPYLTEAKPSLTLLHNLVNVWSVYDERKGTYCSFDQALDAAEARMAAAAASTRSGGGSSPAAGGVNGQGAGQWQGAGGQWVQPGSPAAQASSSVLLPQG